MKSVKLSVIAVTLGVIVGLIPAWADDRATRQAELEQTIAEIDEILRPYKKRSVADGRQGRIFPLDLPSEPTNWRLREKSPPQSIPGKIRILLKAGICRVDTKALRKIFELEWLVYGLDITEAEALFLQRISKLRGLKLPFHRRYRNVKNYVANISETPQLLILVNSAFDSGDVDRAIKLIPDFREMCKK